MSCMSRRSVESSIGKRRTRSGAAAIVIGLLLAFLALPLCSAAFTCTIPHCEHSVAPMEDHGGMPAAACGGSECSVAGVVRTDTEAVLVLQGQTLQALPTSAPNAFSNIAPLASSPYTSLVQPRPNTLRLHVLNDVFLI